VLFCLRKIQGANVLLQRRGEDCYLFKFDGTTEKAPFSNFEEYCELQTTYLPTDGIVPIEIGANCKILEVSSLRKEFWHTFKKPSSVITRYMPTWSLSELIACWKECYSAKVVEEVVYRNFKNFGGVVRYVLAKANDSIESLSDIDEALSRTNLQQALESDGKAGAPEDVSSMILHWKVMDAKGIHQIFYHNHLRIFERRTRGRRS
jgi:hypothetical protein